MNDPKDWTLEEFNDLISTTPPQEILDRLGVNAHSVQRLAAFGLAVFTEGEDDLRKLLLESPERKELLSAICKLGMAMFAAGAEMQRLCVFPEEVIA